MYWVNSGSKNGLPRNILILIEPTQKGSIVNKYNNFKIWHKYNNFKNWDAVNSEKVENTLMYEKSEKPVH